MGDHYVKLTKVSEHRGTIDHYQIAGFKFQTSAGVPVWKIDAGTGEGPVSCYWIVDGKFHDVRTHFVRNENQYEVGAEVMNVPVQERSTVLKAISQWEREDAEKS